MSNAIGSSSSAGRSAVVIPARLASTRLPGKLLLQETGKPLLQHTYEAAIKAELPRHVCVAADSEEIASAVRSFGGKVVMTDPELPSGTDRVAVVAADFEDIEIIVNVQGDEPEIDPRSIDAAITLLQQHDRAAMATLATPIRRLEQLQDPHCVKVVVDQQGCALYFSRAAVPHVRDWDASLLAADPPHFLQHVGLYAYRKEFLLQIPQLSPSPLESLEKLEQLRVLAAGESIVVGLIDEPTIGIDTPEDYRAFVERRGRG